MKQIREEITKLCKDLNAYVDSSWWFGSSFNSEEDFNDIDVALVLKDLEFENDVKIYLKKRWPDCLIQRADNYGGDSGGGGDGGGGGGRNPQFHFVIVDFSQDRRLSIYKSIRSGSRCF